MKSLTSRHKIANAFAGSFAFLPTLEPNQKKQKSLQATAQRQCKLDTKELRPKRATSANSGFKKLAVTWLNEHLFFVSSAVLADSLVLQNRQLLKPATRWPQSHAVKYLRFPFWSNSQHFLPMCVHRVAAVSTCRQTLTFLPNNKYYPASFWELAAIATL